MEAISNDELFASLSYFYEEMMPFNKLLGLKMETLNIDSAVICFSMKEELVGNTHKRILHGGVISSVLDFMGGVIAQLHVIREMEDATGETLLNRLVQMGTIDMRVDFIRPGRGEQFTATGEMLRLGNKVAVVRSLLHNDSEALIAAATGTYMVG